MKTVKKPDRPEDDDCCGGGCSPCIWDYYHQELALWLEQEGQQTLSHTPKDDEKRYR